MKNKNRIQLIGNLGNNPVVMEFGNNKKLAKFSVASTNIFKRNGKTQKDTQWHKIITWDKMADIAEKNLKIGTEVVIEGKIIKTNYKNAKNIMCYSTEILVESMMFRNKKKASKTIDTEFTEQRA